MQSLAKVTNLISTSDCSAQLIDLTPVIMHRIRNEMRRRTIPGLTLPQFRTLSYLQGHPRSSLSDVAAHIGITLPSTSKLVQKLVAQKVVTRRDGADRRRVCLSLTQQGTEALATARLETRKQLEYNLSSLSQKELATVSGALGFLNKAFSRGGAGVNLP